MECNSNDKINTIVNELINLLKRNNEMEWAQVLINILNEYNKTELKKQAASVFVNIMRGGMGSFLDLVLHNNGKPLLEENNHLDDLRQRLYSECKNIYE